MTMPHSTRPSSRLERLLARQMLDGYASGLLCPSEVMDSVITAASGIGATLGAFTHVARREAIEAARRIERLPLGGALAGLPVSVKDDLFTAGILTTGGSRAFATHVPPDEGAAVRRLRSAGAIVFGKTNLSEFAMTLEPGSPLAGVCRNPWDPTRTAGASSSGAAAAVAAGIGPVALATDSGGSIRYPAALCGVIGFKPSGGRVPRFGTFGTNHHFCSIGVIARSMRDVELVLGTISGADASDPATWAFKVPIGASGDKAAKALRVGWLDIGSAVDHPDITALARSTLQRLEGMFDRKTTEASLDPNGCRDDYRTMSDCDRAALMKSCDTLSHDALRAMSPGVAERLERAAGVTGVRYAEALEGRRKLMSQVWALFENVDVLVHSTSPHIAPRFDDDVVARGDEATSRLWWTNFTGCCAASMPIGFVDGLPVGLHLIARPGADEQLLAACRAVEQALDYGNGIALSPPELR